MQYFLRSSSPNFQKRLLRYLEKASLTLLQFLLFCCITIGIQPHTLSAQSFGQSSLDLAGLGVVNGGTSLMFGPDGRLYVLSLSGNIDIFTIQQNGPDDYEVIASEEILAILNIQNHNDDGSIDGSTPDYRESTGLTVAGTAANPIIYVTSSDSRVGGPSGDENLDTNSGVITRLTWNGSSWLVVDIVRGLPRSEENHATNGLEFVTVNTVDYLLVAQGGNNNGGAPSINFAWATEYALSAAILSVNLDMLQAMPILTDGSGRDYIYDLPTVDDPTRSNVNGITDPDDLNYDGIDVNDPWGGNDGLNQAMLIPGGPVQIFSPGYRNAYDLTVTQGGAVYVTDNGANGGWGGFPVNEGMSGTVTNEYDPFEVGSYDATADGEEVDNEDHLTMVTDNIQAYSFGSFYGGHPVPIRANPSGAGLTTNATNAPAGVVFRQLPYDPNGGAGKTSNIAIALPANWPPVLAPANIVEGDWRGPTIPNPDGPNDVLVTTWTNNTNGIDEYTASNFGGAMQGDLIAGKNGGELKRVEMSSPGVLSNLTNTFASNLGGNALGITCNSDSDPFPGTIWVATFNNAIIVLEPKDAFTCLLPGDGGYDANDDNDSDGYSNQDEIDNKSASDTDQDVICNGSNQPNDFDKAAAGTLVSDFNDPDDDADGILDANDPFQMGDPTDGGSDAFDLPVQNELFSDNPTLKGYLGLGFTGMMNNGAANPNWLNWVDQLGAGPNPNDILGGAVGAMTMQMTEGTALGASNSQDKGFQYGVNVSSSTGDFTVESRLFNFYSLPQIYGTNAPANGEIGIFMGDGTQSNYIKVVLTQSGITALQEINDVPQTPLTATILTGDRPLDDVIFYFNVDPVTGDVEIQYSLDTATPVSLGTIAAQGSILTAIQQAATPLAVGFIGSSNTIGEEIESTWDYLNVAGSRPFIAQVLPDVDKLINAPDEDTDLDAYFEDNNGTANLTYTVEGNTNTAIGASITGNTLTLSFPSAAAASDITIRATDAGALFVEQTFTVTVTEQAGILFRVNAGDVLIPATDAGNPDWSANVGTGAQAGAGFTVNGGSISEFEDLLGRDASVPSYAPQSLFFFERSDPWGLPELEWTFNTGNGTFNVNLFMGNGYSGTATAGDRVFDVEMEGILVVDDKDLSAEYGHEVGAMESYQVTVADGVLDIKFIHQVENPLINAIEITAVGSVTYPAITLSPVNDQSDELGETPILNIIASGGNPSENFAFSATGLPPGLSIEPTNGAILGTISSDPADIAVYNAAITVSKPSSTPIVLNLTWTISAAVSFPIELLAFDGYVINSQTSLLRWATASEFENAYFEIEKSSNQQDFEVIGQVGGAGTSTEIQSYSLMDHTPMYPTNYYRLRQVDFDGATTTSDIIELSAQDVLRQLSIYPNPAQESMWVSLVVENPAIAYRLVIRDVRGRVREETRLSADILLERYRIDLTSYTEGIYSLELLSNDGKKYSTRFIKSRR